MVVTGAISLADALSPASIDYETLLLLFSMMIVIAALREGGVFDALPVHRLRAPRALLAATIVVSGVLSAFLVNDIVCVALTPLVLHMARRLRCDPMPHLIGLATASNIGSVATITGNPQNMIIGLHSRIPYRVFAAHLMPVALVGLVIAVGIIAAIYTTALSAASPMPDAPSTTRPRMLPVVVAVVTVALFCAGLPIAVVAAGAAAVILVTSPALEPIYNDIDWRLLVMFAGLFVVVHAFQLRVLSQWALPAPGSIASLGALTAVLSNVVSNVPAVLLLEPFAHNQAAWLTLAMSSTLAGNLTILGSVANLIVVERARRDGVVISFLEYAKAGVPITLATLALGLLWLR
jgi:Na+/H+ antiporter NhaD/arsenite permease-like protein